jgi:mono/diheme cytochrome c family protein
MKNPKAGVLAGLMLAVTLVSSSIPAWSQSGDGKDIYDNKCAICHGKDGKGAGPAAGSFSPPPAKFADPGFWQGNVDQKIADAINNGHGPMPPVSLSPGKIKEVTSYMTQTFK